MSRIIKRIALIAGIVLLALAVLSVTFYQVDKARTRAYGGTGIGLSVVAAIMKAHQMPYGVYNRQSASETGVEFYFELESR